MLNFMDKTGMLGQEMNDFGPYFCFDSSLIQMY